jgi:FMN phosphatase YigB (HAD superfamily)
MNLLFLNVGRRCELVESFRRALRRRGNGRIFGSDISPLAPGLQVVDHSAIFPHGDSPEFPAFLSDFCRDYAIDLVIPTIDPDLARLDSIRPAFEKKNPKCRLLLPCSFTVQHALDKRLSKKLFVELGAEVPEFADPNGDCFPVFVKPPGGSSSQGAGVVYDRETLHRRLGENPELIVEHVVAGPEYTVDVLLDFSAKALCAVSRRRIRVRDGEVTQGIVERNVGLEKLAMQLGEGFRATGPVTIQFRQDDLLQDGLRRDGLRQDGLRQDGLRQDDQGHFLAIELNARMAGGLPLTIAAGADWPGWILDLCLEKPVNTRVDIADGMVMTRCDRSFFLPSHRVSQGDASALPREIPPAVAKERLFTARGWIFDMDDTLYPERDFVFSGFRAVAAKVYDDFRLDIEGELREGFLEGLRGDLFTRALQLAGVAVEEHYVQALVKVYRTHRPEIRPHLDVIPMLTHLKKRGVRIALMTDGWHQVQERKLAALGIASFFEEIVYTDSIRGTSSWRPATDGFLKCLKSLRLDARETLFLADNPIKDFVGARKLGITTVRIHRRGAEHENEQPIDSDHAPDLNYASLQEILTDLERAHDFPGNTKTKRGHRPYRLKKTSPA